MSIASRRTGHRFMVAWRRARRAPLSSGRAVATGYIDAASVNALLPEVWGSHFRKLSFPPISEIDSLTRR